MTEYIRTKSFKLAAYAKGNVNADKVALVLPGRLDTKDYVHTTSLVDMLAGRGYHAISFDPPGTWESAGGINQFNTTNYLQAVAELIGHFGDKPTLLVGFSRGGSVAMLGAGNPAVQAVIGVMANIGPPSPPLPGTMEAGYELVSQDVPPGVTRFGGRRKFKLPVGYFTDGQRYDPGEALKKSRKPKLLIYGSRDRFTDPNSVQRLFTELQDPKMIHEIDSAHVYRIHPEVIEDVNKSVEAFLKKYNL